MIARVMKICYTYGRLPMRHIQKYLGILPPSLNVILEASEKTLGSFVNGMKLVTSGSIFTMGTVVGL